MSDDGELYEPFATQEFFADNIDHISIVNGVFRCILYSLQVIPPSQVPVKVAVARIAMPVSSAGDAARRALTALTVKAITSPQDVFAEAKRPELVS